MSARTARYRQARKDRELAVLEGFHAIKHALRFDAEILEILTRDKEELLALAQDLAPDVEERLSEGAEQIEADLFDTLAPHPPPTGAIALARRCTATPEDVLEAEGLVVFLDRPNHLGNLGAVIRVAAAADAAGVLTTGRHDPWTPEALRASAGLHFAIPVARCEKLPQTLRPIVAMDPEGEPRDPRDLAADAILAFGSERSGLGSNLLVRTNVRLAIPMREGISSLNLATAASAVLFAHLRINRAAPEQD